jgi:hypothetical protein
MTANTAQRGVEVVLVPAGLRDVRELLVEALTSDQLVAADVTDMRSPTSWAGDLTCYCGCYCTALYALTSPAP